MNKKSNPELEEFEQKIFATSKKLRATGILLMSITMLGVVAQLVLYGPLSNKRIDEDDPYGSWNFGKHAKGSRGTIKTPQNATRELDSVMRVNEVLVNVLRSKEKEETELKNSINVDEPPKGSKSN